jgi:hypothetical protein
VKQLGTILVFRPGVTKEQAREALKALEPLLARDYFGGDGRPPIQSFDPECGGPVWYVP